MVDRQTTENISNETVKGPMDDLEIQSIEDTIDSQSSTDDDEENSAVSDQDYNAKDQAVTNEPASDMDIPEHDQSLITDSSDTSMTDDDDDNDDDDDDIEDLISVDKQSIEEADKISHDNAVDQPEVVSAEEDVENEINNDPPQSTGALSIDDDVPEQDASMTSESETTMDDDDDRLTAVTVDSDMDVESLHDNGENLMSNDDAKNLVDDKRTLPIRSPAKEEINMNSMSEKEKSNISSMIGSDTNLSHTPTADRQSPAKLISPNQTPPNVSVDEEKSSLLDNNDELAQTMNHPRSTRPSIVISRKPSFAASANQPLTNMSIDEESVSLLDNNDLTLRDVVLNGSRSTRPSIVISRKPSFAASANRTLANMSIDEENVSLLEKNDLTLRDVVLNGSRNTRPSIVTSQKSSFAASPNQNMSVSNSFFLPDEVLTRNSQGAMETNVHDKSVPLRLNSAADNSMINDETFDNRTDLDEEDTDSLIDTDDDISTITLEKENRQNISHTVRPEQPAAPIEHDNDLLTSLPLNIEMTRNLTVNIEKPGESPTGTGRRMIANLDRTSPLGTSAQGRLLHPDEKQKSNMSSGSSMQRSISSRRNTEHTIVDLSKVANVPGAPEKAELAKLSNARRSVVILDHRSENTMQSPARTTSLSFGKENFRPLLNSTDAEGLMENAEKSPSFLPSRAKSDSFEKSFDVTNDNESIDKFDIHDETTDSIKSHMIRSSTNAPPRKTPRLSFIDNAHVIQINSSKESHMRALPAEKFWRRNQRRVSTVPSAETGQAAPT